MMQAKKRPLYEVFEQIALDTGASLLEVTMNTDIIIEPAVQACFWDATTRPDVLICAVPLDKNIWDFGPVPAPRIGELKVLFSMNDIRTLLLKKGLNINIEERGDFAKLSICFGRNLVQFRAEIESAKFRANEALFIRECFVSYCKRRTELTAKVDFPLSRDEAFSIAKAQGKALEHIEWEEGLVCVLVEDSLKMYRLETKDIRFDIPASRVNIAAYETGWRVAEDAG